MWDRGRSWAGCGCSPGRLRAAAIAALGDHSGADGGGGDGRGCRGERPGALPRADRAAAGRGVRGARSRTSRAPTRRPRSWAGRPWRRPGRCRSRSRSPTTRPGSSRAHSYGVRGRILVDGRLWFATTDAYRVLTRGQGDRVELLLRRVSQAAEQAASEALGALPATFVGELPCADCPGIRHQLDLWPDGAFFLRRTYLGREPGQRLRRDRRLSDRAPRARLI